jgi:hypothetical protein
MATPAALSIVEKPLFLFHRNPRWIIVDFFLPLTALSRLVSRLNESAAAGLQVLPSNLCAPRLSASAL